MNKSESPFVGHWIKPDGWEWGSVLKPGMPDFCEYYLPVQSKGPITEVGVNVQVTGKTNVRKWGLVLRRVRITFVGDYEPDTTSGGWLEVPAGFDNK